MRAKKNLKRAVAVLSKLTSKRQLVIPEDVCKDLGAQAGDYIEFVKKEDEIIIRAKKLVDARGLEQRVNPLTWDDLKSDVPTPASKQEILDMLKDLQGDAEDDSGDIDVDRIAANRTYSNKIVHFD